MFVKKGNKFILMARSPETYALRERRKKYASYKTKADCKPWLGESITVLHERNKSVKAFCVKIHETE